MDSDQLKEEIRLRLIKSISKAEHKMTQRDLAKHAGISLGKTNYWVTAMVKEGIIKIERFKKADNKSACKYILTSRGLEEKYRLLIHFLSRKLREYEMLRKEIDKLNQEILKYSVSKESKV